MAVAVGPDMLVHLAMHCGADGMLHGFMVSELRDSGSHCAMAKAIDFNH